MGMFLGSLGFVGVIAGIIWLIVAAIKRNNKQIPLIILAVCFVIFIAGVSIDSADKAADRESLQEQKTTETSQIIPQPKEVTESSVALLVVLLWVLLGAGLYFLPTMLAILRHKRNTPMILVVNFFSGWTFIGWCIALAWSLTQDREERLI